MIKVLLFDIDNTLFPTKEFVEIARRNAIKAMISVGLPYDEGFLYKKLLKVIERYGSNYPKHFDVLLKELMGRAESKYVAAGVRAYHDTKASMLPFPEVPITLMRLKQKGYRIYVATEGRPVKQWDKLIRLGLVLFFDDVFVGKRKDEKFFHKVLKRCRVKPEEAMMIGDRYDKDILPAKKVGIKTFWVGGERGKSDYFSKNLRKLLDVLS